MSDTLENLYPQLASLWDIENNYIMPNKVSVGSHFRAYWICHICSYSYDREVQNQVKIYRQRGLANICPICRGKRIVPEYNSLKAKFPEIVEAEWDYEKNTVTPDQVAPHTNKKVWWRCPNGHSYSSSPNNKLNGGGDCPYCSSQKLSTERSLSIVNPELSKEWHPTRNGDLTPSDVFANTNKYIWWLCPKCGHEWRATASNRHCGKRGCPRCANSRSSSVPEQLMFRAIKRIFPDAINRHRINNDELDVYIPSIKTGFEYDGQQYHNEDKLPKDIEKSNRLINIGIVLYRFRESECPTISVKGCIVLSVDHTADYSHLEKQLREVLLELEPSCAEKMVKFKDEINDVIASLDDLPYEKSFAALEDKKLRDGVPLIAKWDYEANAPLTPEMVMPYSDREVSWICPNNPKHKWRNTIKSVSLGYGCKRCSKRHQYSTEEWIEAAKSVHGNKFQYHLVEYVDSATKVNIVCPKHGIFQQAPSEHLSGKGCQYCAHQLFHPLESLAELHPEIAKEWDYERNADTGFTPTSIGIDSKRKFYWHCNNGYAHSYLSTIAMRVSRNSGCAICHGKQLAYETSLGALYPELAKEWCEENDKTPYEVSPGSEYNALWRCSNPNHPKFRCMVINRTKHNVGCVYCHGGKKHPKDYENELKVNHPNIKLLKPFTKASERVECQCEICGYIWAPFPYNLLKGKGCPKCLGGIKN